MDTVQVQFNLQCRVRQDTDSRWVSWCPLLDIASQGATKDEAKRCLEEAVELWVESCLERATLDAALRELGFEKVHPAEIRPGEQHLTATGAELADDTFPVHLLIPAYQAAALLTA